MSPEEKALHRAYWASRYEHAYRVRLKGETYEQIGYRLNVSRERISQMIATYARKNRKLLPMGRHGKIMDRRYVNLGHR